MSPLAFFHLGILSGLRKKTIIDENNTFDRCQTKKNSQSRMNAKQLQTLPLQNCYFIGRNVRKIRIGQNVRFQRLSCVGFSYNVEIKLIAELVILQFNVFRHTCIVKSWYIIFLSNVLKKYRPLQKLITKLQRQKKPDSQQINSLYRSSQRWWN